MEETVETVGVSEELFNQRMDSLDNILFGSFAVQCLILGCLLAGMVMRWFHVR